MDATIIGDPAPYHFHVPSPSESSSSVLVNTRLINENPHFVVLTMPFDTMYTIPISIWSYKESANSLNADISISLCEASTRLKPNTFPDPRWFPYSCMFVLTVTRP